MDAEAEWLILPIVTVDGSAPKPQSMASRVDNFVFVKKGSKYPEAVVKVINVNLEQQNNEDIVGEEGIKEFDPEIKTSDYKFAKALERPNKNLDMQDALVEAFKNDDPSELTPDAMNIYNMIIYGLETRENSFNLVFGFEPNSTFYLMKQNMINKNYVVNAFQGPYTDTMVENMELMDTSLDEAMFAVIMGADISVFDDAVTVWKAGTGGTMTQEVNEWWAKNK